MIQYETALQRFYDGVHPPTLLCLARTWFTKANREGNFSAMTFALRYAQKVSSTSSFPFSSDHPG
jgi:hypothetical protein